MISYLFSTPERVKILEQVLFNDDLTNSEITRRTGVNKGLISVYLRELVNRGLLIKNGSKYICSNSIIVKQIKILMNLITIGSWNIDTTNILGMGIFGSWATGENTHISDLDLWIMLEKIDNRIIGEVLSEISINSDVQTDILVLTKQKWKMIKENDPPFYRSITWNGITIHGDDLE